MAGGGEEIELKFRLIDGTDIGPLKFAPTATVAQMKESIIQAWPTDKEGGPTAIQDMKLINGGKILENNLTLAESRVPLGEAGAGIAITMHLVVRQPTNDKSQEKPYAKVPKDDKCGRCVIL
ncbi:hypothetical protein CBR_g805 [Chara braunii]|uniref:Membrane-anchored ubiquitin-fold protein n=1 Tax=Chara braunii TaxID=69332 RepID=A0A388KC90_CHABU|nr:hypothetical protein CBR_g805 [Chara braunii]|eukprot:GBG67675.1 hypothetical protein CBR_g805 [Chara braunii]